MATVFLARDTKHTRPVALKVLRPELAASLGAERFRREISLAARLQHPHILSVHDSGQTPDGQLWFTMPYVEGESLRHRLRLQRRLPLDDALRITREVAFALDYAHRHGVIHRDIKPENILLVDGQAMVADFGIARPLASATPGETLTETGVAIGTPAYMSPEQAAGEHNLDATTDVYSLGAVLYEMLAGEAPYTGPSAQAIAAKMMAGDPPSIRRTRPAVPDAVDAAVRKALSPVPADRWATAAEFARVLDTAERTATASRATPAPARSAPGIRRRMFAAAAVVLVLAVIGFGTVVGRRLWSGASGGAKRPTVAVLPFNNLGAAEDDYFADGMTEELTSRLARLSGLSVIARTSAMQYKRTTKPIQQIARELGADYLIEGSVRWEKEGADGSRVRITPQLIRANDGTDVWAEPYEEPYGTGIFKMQSEIADRVATAMSVTLVGGERQEVKAMPTTNLKAYDYFLRGQQYEERSLGQDWERERATSEMYQKAVALDPKFALAHASIGRVYLTMISDGYDMSLGTGITLSQRLQMARDEANQALALDPDLPDAHGVLGKFYYYTGDTVRSREEWSRVRKPAATAAGSLVDSGWMLVRRGRVAEATELFDKAIALDPLNVNAPGLAWGLGSIGQYRLAERYYDHAIDMAPDQPYIYVAKAWLLVAQGRLDESWATMREGARRAGLTRMVVTASRGSVWVRLLRIFNRDYAPVLKGLSWDSYGADSADYYSIKIIAYEDDPPRAHAYADSLLAWARPHATRGGETNPEYSMIVAWALAVEGRPDAAVAALTRLYADTSFSWNISQSQAEYREYAAEVYVLAGKHDWALQQIDTVIADGGLYLTPGLLKLEPVWAPLRGDPRYERMIRDTARGGRL